MVGDEPHPAGCPSGPGQGWVGWQGGSQWAWPGATFEGLCPIAEPDPEGQLTCTVTSVEADTFAERWPRAAEAIEREARTGAGSRASSR